MKKGIFVGSFNPPTNFHFDIGHYLYNHKIVDEIIYVPINKKNNLLSLETRKKMLEIYLNSYSYMKVSIVSESRNFDYQFLNCLYQNDDDIYMIIGSDILNKIDCFNNYEDILSKYIFIVINRDNNDDLEVIRSKFPLYENKFILLSMMSDVSSSLIRSKINSHESIADLTKDIVVDYIDKNKYYLE